MTVRVRLPDGSHVEVATDDPKAAAAAAQKHWSKQTMSSSWKGPGPLKGLPPVPQHLLKKRPAGTPRPAPAKAPAAKPSVDLIGAFARDVVDQFTPNWADELYAAPRAAIAAAQGGSFGETFRKEQAGIHQEQKLYDELYPKTAWGSTLTGQGLGLALLRGRAAPGASMGAKMTQGAKIGAAYGGAAGLGDGDGLDLGTRLKNGAIGAVVGGGLGTLIPPGVEAGASIGGRILNYIPGGPQAIDAARRGVNGLMSRITGNAAAPVPTRAEATANRMAGSAMERGTMATGGATPGPAATPQRIAAEVERRNAMGVPAMVGDTTESMRQMTGWASRGMGPGQTMVRERLSARKLGEASRVRQHVQETMPTTPDPVRFVDDAKARTSAAVRPLYDEAYARPMYVSPEIQAIQATPAFRSALPQAYDNILNQIDEVTGLPKDPRAMGFRWVAGRAGGKPPKEPHFAHPEGGYIVASNDLSVEGFDQVARAMSAAGNGGATSNTVHVNARAKDLRQYLADQNDPYRQAIERFGDDSAHLRAFEAGQGIDRLSGPEIAQASRLMPDPTHQTFATGAGTAMADEASAFGARYPNGDTARRVNQMLGDDSKRAALDSMAGGQGRVSALADRLEAEHQGNINWKGVHGNSETANRQAFDAEMDAAIGRPRIPTNPTAMVGQFVGFLADRAAPKFREDVRKRVAEIVTASNARTVEEVVQAIEAQAARDRQFAALLHRSGMVVNKMRADAMPTNADVE